MMRLCFHVLTTLFFITSASCSDAPEEPLYPSCPPGFQMEQIGAGQHMDFMSSGQSRSFHLFLPAGATEPGPHPLGVVFHDTDWNGKEFTEDALMPGFVDTGFILLALDGNDNGPVWPDWDAIRNENQQADINHDLIFYDDAVACIQEMYPIDNQRIFVIGKSAGAIMVNYVLGRRSDSIAGGIVGSGWFDLTQPIPATPLSNMTVIMTFGGDNDQWSGGANDNPEDENEEYTPTASVDFSSQTTVASQYWEDAIEVNQIQCKGGDIGHEWIRSINVWMANYLLAHPKDNHENPEYVFESPENDEGAVCTEGVAEYVPTIVSDCGEIDHDCVAYCQLIADCGVENATIVSVLAETLTVLGFSGENSTECGGCVDACKADLENTVDLAKDEEVLACIAERQSTSECGQGLAGAQPIILGINLCCKESTDSAVCTRFCEAALLNEPVTNAGVFFTCDDWKTEEEAAGSDE